MKRHALSGPSTRHEAMQLKLGMERMIVSLQEMLQDWDLQQEFHLGAKQESSHWYQEMSSVDQQDLIQAMDACAEWISQAPQMEGTKKISRANKLTNQEQENEFEHSFAI